MVEENPIVKCLWSPGRNLLFKAALPFLGVVGCTIKEPSTTANSNQTPEITQACAEVSRIESIPVTAAKRKVAVWPEHECLPIHYQEGVNPLNYDLPYMVRLEPVGQLGQLKAEVVYSANESDLLTSNCIDINQKAENTDVTIGRHGGLKATFNAYPDWFLEGATVLCDIARSGQKSPVPSIAGENVQF